MRPATRVGVLVALVVLAGAATYLATKTDRGHTLAVQVWAYVASHWRLLLPVGIVGVVSWSVWGVRKLLSALYRPTVNDFRTTTSVVVPSFHEDPDVLDALLDTWLGQDPTRSSWCWTWRTRRPATGCMARRDRGCA